VLIGNRVLLEGERVPTGGLTDAAEDLAADGKTAMFVAVDGRPTGLSLPPTSCAPPRATRSPGSGSWAWRSR
jgi:Cu+-exporting ATPase